MKVNLDGLRAQLTQCFNSLADDLDDAISNGDIDSHRSASIIDHTNNLAQIVDVLNCVYDDDSDGFSDLSEKLKVIRISDG